jgi:hypothetical protein
MIQDLSNLISTIRDYINKPRKQYRLLKDLGAWHQLCSSMDIIQDIELALDAALTLDGKITEGKCYLNIFGTLQALFVQQDAIYDLAEALNISIPKESILKNIRDIRNDSIGHPTKRKSGKSFHFIVRAFIAPLAYQLMTSYPDGNTKFRDINVRRLIEQQRDVLKVILGEVIGKLKEEELKHKKKHKEIKLQEIFPSTLQYYFEKISEAIFGEKSEEFGAMHVNLIINIIDDFKKELKKRDVLEAYDPIKYYLDLIEYPLTELHNFFKVPENTKLDKKDAYIFMYFINNHIEKLIKIAEELDEEYSAER